MSTFRFALAQFDFPVGATADNALRVKALAEEARDRLGASLIAFPELTLSGYPPEDLLQRPSFLEACGQELEALAPRIEGISAIVGHPDTRGEVYNAATLIREGKLEWTYHKQALPNYTVFDEKRYFQHGETTRVFTIDGVRVVAFTFETPTGQPQFYAKKETLGLDLRHPYFRTVESYDNDGKIFEKIVFETITPKTFDDSTFDPKNKAYKF